MKVKIYRGKNPIYRGTNPKVKVDKYIMHSHVVRPTIVREKSIILDIQHEIIRKPNDKAMEHNARAVALLKKLRGQ